MSGCNFLTTVILARALGLSAFGTYALVWAGVQFLNNVQMALIIAPMMSIGPAGVALEAAPYYRAVVTHQLAFSAGSAILISAIGGTLSFWNQGLASILYAAALAAAFFQLQDFVRRYFFCRGESSSALCNDLISYGGQILVLAFLWSMHQLNVVRALAVVCVTSAAALVAAAPDLRLLLSSREPLHTIRARHWKFSRWLLASTVLDWSSSQAVLLIPPLFLGTAAAGAIRSSQALVGVLNVWFQGLQNVLPVESAAAYRSGGSSALIGYIRSTIRRWTVLTAVAAIALAVCAPTFLRVVYGREFASIPQVLMWVALAAPLTFTCLSLMAGLRAIEATRPIFLGFIFAAVTSIAFATGGAWIGSIGTCAAGLLFSRTLQLLITGSAFSVRTRHTSP
ncbi:MAG: lipopolysaccharide biosynthesis protein [Terriglobales bacterium]